MWKEEETVIYYVPEKFNNAGHIAATDWVNTLISSIKGDSTPRTATDFVWTRDGIPTFLNDLNSKGWTVTIFSNYSNIQDKQILRDRFKNMVKSGLNFYPFIFISLRQDRYSKPRAGMWDLFLRETKLQPSDIKPTSWYTGDKAGELGLKPDRKVDATDYLFAQNIGLTFYDVEEVFPPQPQPVLPVAEAKGPTLVINVGNIGAGKTTYSLGLAEKGFLVLPKNDKPNVNKARKALLAGKNVVIDATNPSRDKRAPLIALAKETGATPVILWFSRSGITSNKLRGEEEVPRFAITNYMNLFEEPSEDEGAKVYRIN